MPTNGDTWTVGRILDWMESYLRGHGDGNPRLSAQWLVSDALGLSRIELFLDMQRPLTESERSRLRGYTRRRAAGEPLQYITGTTGFRFISLHVEKGVLIPRPETEVLVSEALSELEVDTARKKKALGLARRAELEDLQARMRLQAVETGEGDAEALRVLEEAIASIADADGGPGPGPNVLDLCTGSGCIACSIAHEVPGSRVVATDIDPAAVSLARRNAADLGLESQVIVVECDIAEHGSVDSRKPYDLVISNPPYVPSGVLAALDGEVRDYEPDSALDGGPDGLDAFRRILGAAGRLLRPDGVLAVELFEDRLEQAGREAREAGFRRTRIANDLTGRQRVLIARKE